MDTLIVTLLVLLALLYAVRRIARLLRGRGGCANARCPSCPAHRSCGDDTQTTDADND